MSRELLDGGGAGAFGPAVTSAFEKIRALLTPRALELVDRMRRSVGARAVGAKLALETHVPLAEIQRALAERRTLRMRYYSLSRAAETDRRVDPYHLTFFIGGLYLLGWCHLRREVRIFAVERIRSASALAETFAMPAGGLSTTRSPAGPTSRCSFAGGAAASPRSPGSTVIRAPLPGLA